MKKVRYVGTDLERWRVENGFEVTDMQHIFALQPAGWYQITKHKGDEPLKDRVLARLLHLYKTHPEVAPKCKVDVKAVYHNELGLKACWKDENLFAHILGHTYSNVHRVIGHGAALGKKPERLLEACMRLGGDAAHKRRIMQQIADEVEVEAVKQDEKSKEKA